MPSQESREPQRPGPMRIDCRPSRRSFRLICSIEAAASVGLRPIHTAGIDHDEIGDGLAPPMSESDLGLDDRPWDHRLVELELDIHVFEDHRPELENVEGLASPEAGLDIGSELHLGRACEPGLAGVEQPGQDVRQRHDPSSKQGVNVMRGDPPSFSPETMRSLARS